MNTLFLYRTTPRIRLKEFNALAEPKVAEAVNELRGKGATSFVLDLRDNPGGLVQAGVEIARLFLPPDVNVAYTEGRVVAGGVKGDTDVDATATAAARAKARAQARGGSGGTTKETRVGLFASVDGSAAKKGGVNATTNATTNAVTPETKLKSIPASTSPGSGGAAIVSGAFCRTLVPVRPRRRGEHRSLRTLSPGVCFSPPRVPRSQSRRTHLGAFQLRF